MAVRLAKLPAASGWTGDLVSTGHVWPKFNAADYGCVADGSADDTTAIQDCVDAAVAWAATASRNLRGITIRLPAGRVKLTAQIDLPMFPCQVQVQGEGVYSTTVKCASDFGAGEFAFKPATLGSSPEYVFRDFALQGPNTSTTIGTAPCEMGGIRVPGGGRAENLRIDYFKYGVEFTNDHNTLRDVRIAACFYCVYYGENTAESDQSIERCNFTDPLWANIGVKSDNVMGGTTMISTHLGYGPYGIWKEGSGAIMAGCVLIDSQFEGCANAVIASELDEASNKVENNWFINCGQANLFSGAAAYAAPGEPQTAAIRCGEFNQNYFLGSSILTATAKGSEAVIKCTSISSCVFDFSGADGTAIVQNLVKLATAGDVLDCLFRWKGQQGRLYRAKTAITQYDLLRNNTTGTTAPHVKRYDTSGAPVVGVALHAAASDEIVFVVQDGFTKIRTDAGTAWPSNTFIKPDTVNAGCVVPSSGWTDGPIVGHNTSSSSSGLITCRVRA